MGAPVEFEAFAPMSLDYWMSLDHGLAPDRPVRDHARQRPLGAALFDRSEGRTLASVAYGPLVRGSWRWRLVWSPRRLLAVVLAWEAPRWALPRAFLRRWFGDCSGSFWYGWRGAWHAERAASFAVWAGVQ